MSGVRTWVVTSSEEKEESMNPCFICQSTSSNCGHREALGASVTPNYAETHRKSAGARRIAKNRIPWNAGEHERLAKTAERARQRHLEPYVVMVTDWNGDTYKWGYSHGPTGDGAIVTARLVNWITKAWVERV